MEEMGVARDIHALIWAPHPPGTCMYSPAQKLPEPHRLGVIMEVSLLRHDCFIIGH